MSYKPTDEQQAVIDAAVGGGNGVVKAYAGAGKTSTLKDIAKAMPRKRGFYIAYNRAIADDAKATFPRNVQCATAHSVAFRTVGLKYKHRLSTPRQTWNQTAGILKITKGFKVNEDVFLRPAALAGMINDTLKRFCYSADEFPGPQHVKFVPGTEGVFDDLTAYLNPFLLRAWEDIRNVDGILKFQHDYYLKMWALTHPVMRVDFLMLDEAQDANPVISNVVMEQECQKILVGDENQQIYAWRGAEDAMEGFGGDWERLLSQSFRFGPAVAHEANKWLKLLGNTVPLKGFDAIDAEVRELDNPKCILARTNATVIAEAMRIQEKGNTVAIVGGTGEIMSFARAVRILQQNSMLPDNARQSVDHPDLMAFSTWNDVKEYVEQEGSDLRTLVNMVDTYGVEAIIRVADTAIDESYADTILSTAHKAKGREWRSVKIAGDFKEPVDEETGERKPNRAEFMLNYVAVTRAMEVLDCSSLDWVDSWVTLDDSPIIASDMITPEADPSVALQLQLDTETPAPLIREPGSIIAKARKKSRKRRS